jgi:transcription elongation factor Elf1
MDIIARKEMLKAIINSQTLEILCPTCNKNNFTIFRRDKTSEELYLNHCKCENCGQLFIYSVDKKNNPV